MWELESGNWNWELECGNWNLDLGALWIKLKMIWTIAVRLFMNHRSQCRVSDEQAWIGFNRTID